MIQNKMKNKIFYFDILRKYNKNIIRYYIKFCSKIDCKII